MNSSSALLVFRSARLFLCAATLATLHVPLHAQSDPVPHSPLDGPTHTFFLTNVTGEHDANELVTALRNIVAPTDKVFLLPSRNAIVFSGRQEEIDLAQRLITELDRPKKVYKLTYTLAETDNGKRVGIQHFDVVVLSGQKVLLKQGSKVPYRHRHHRQHRQGTHLSQFTYLDVGINIDAEIIQGGDRITLKTKVERSSVAEEPSTFGAQDPIIRQALVEGEVNLEDGKPLIIGSMDVVGSTRHIDVDVVAHTLP